jgi:hypothetical protein
MHMSGNQAMSEVSARVITEVELSIDKNFGKNDSS